MTDDEFERDVKDRARHFPYPPTPEIYLPRTRMRRMPVMISMQRFALATSVMLIVVMCALVLSPPMRAMVREWLGIGAVTVAVRDNTDLDLPEMSATALHELFEQTTYIEAQNRVEFTLRTPEMLRTPDAIFTDRNYSQVVMVWWQEETYTSEIEVALHQFAINVHPLKVISEETDAEVTEVAGNLALWIAEPHTFELDDVMVLVEGNTLIWEDTGITYRLESDLTLESAVELAESLE